MSDEKKEEAAEPATPELVPSQDADATGEPYGGEPFDYRVELERMGFIMTLAQTIRIEECEAYIEHVHAVGPILDPTAYRAGMQNLDDQRRMIRAYRPLVIEARALVKEAKERKAATEKKG